MSNVPHTPGPWRLAGHLPVVATDRGNDSIVIARIEMKGDGYKFEENWEARLANATLLAASPDMYEVLTEIRNDCNEQLFDEIDKASDEQRISVSIRAIDLKRLRDVVKKASGK